MCERRREPIAIVTAIECHELVVERLLSRVGIVGSLTGGAYHAPWSLGELGRDFETYIVSCAERARANGRFARKHVISTLDCR